MSFWQSLTRKPSATPRSQFKPDWFVSFDATEEAPEFSQAEPVYSASRQFALVGDVWLANAETLRAQLQAHVSSDLEIIAHLWEQQGAACLSHLQGMFAFAVWDVMQRRLWLVRDPVGARTLYFAQQDQRTLIAPRSQKLADRLRPAIDLVALRDYLSCAFVPGERTMWQGISEIRPGTMLQLPERKATTYWQVEERITDAERPIEWHAKRLRAELDQVISEYLPANEAVGCYLSGGLDSSLVAALAKRLHTQPVHTYSIHFGSATPNELEFSSLVAEHCQTKHQIIEITPQQMWEQLAEALSLLDDPIGDPLTVPNLVLGRVAKQDVSVILNGEGGDPCFGGPKNQPMLLSNLYQTADPALAPDCVSAYLDSYQKCAADLPRLLKPDVWQAVNDLPSVFAPELMSEGNYLNQLMFINTKFKGADHILTKVSNLTRAVGLSGRSPLFDRRIVDLSLTIPPEYKLSGAIEKAVLKAAVADVLPSAILERPKSGMMVPVQYWFRELWSRQAKALLLHRHARIREFLAPEIIKDWLAYRGDTWSRYGVKLWLLVSLELWLQTHQIP